jgi:hypothetical protein
MPLCLVSLKTPKSRQTIQSNFYFCSRPARPKTKRVLFSLSEIILTCTSMYGFAEATATGLLMGNALRLGKEAQRGICSTFITCLHYSGRVFHTSMCVCIYIYIHILYQALHQVHLLCICTCMYVCMYYSLT